MEFARRGPATAAIDEGVFEERRRSLDTPSQPHGDTMLVIRDALLLQLQQYRLRQEIIMAELAKIDRAMALSSTLCHGVVAGDVEWTKLPSFSFSEKVMPHSRWPVSPEHWANVDCHHDLKEDARLGGPESGFVKSAMQDRVGECSRPCCIDKKLEENATPDAQKLEEYNENVQSKESSKWELTEITIPVKKPKSPQKWPCTICHVETISKQQLQEHYSGRKHRSNMAMLESRNKDISQTAEMAAEPSLYEGQKTCPIKWSCSTCQANGTSEAELKEHLNSSTHQLSIEEQCKEGDDMTKVAELPEAKTHQEKQPQIRSGSICEAICTRESELGSQLSANILHETYNILRNSESPGVKLPSNIVPQSEEQTSNCSIYQANCDHQSDLADHLRGMIHQLKMQTLHEEAKQTENTSPQIDQNQPALKWDCSICEVKCHTESQFEYHCSGKKHQRKIKKALKRERKKVGLCALKMQNEGPSDGSDNMNMTSDKVVEQMTPCVSDVCNSLCGSETVRADQFSGEEHLEKQKNFCEVCDVQCNSEKMLVHHRTGKKHLKNLKAKQ